MIGPFQRYFGSKHQTINDIPSKKNKNIQKIQTSDDLITKLITFDNKFTQRVLAVTEFFGSRVDMKEMVKRPWCEALFKLGTWLNNQLLGRCQLVSPNEASDFCQKNTCKEQEKNRRFLPIFVQFHIELEQVKAIWSLALNCQKWKRNIGIPCFC